jgi:hypothetical protein
MKTKIYIYCYLFFAFSLSCWGQVKVLNLPSSGVYNKPLKFEDDTINIFRLKQNAHFSFLKITDSVDFNGSTFQNIAKFTDSEFQNIAKFSFSTFQDIADFRNSRFQNQANFYVSIFQDIAFFRHSRFQDQAIFFALSFQNIANFEKSRFQNIANFTDSRFQNIANFTYSEFQNKVIFNGSTFQNEVYFRSSIFNYYTSFQESHGGGKLFFTDAQMPNILVFSGIDSLKVDFREVRCDSLLKWKYLSPLSLQSSKYDSSFYAINSKLFLQSQISEKCVIQLKGTNLSNIILPHDRFWADTTGYSYEEKASLYEKLIKVCKEEGMDESVEGWSIELKKIQNQRTGEFTLWGYHFTFAGKFYNWFQKTFWNFGFTKSYILCWVFILFILFS